MISIKTKLQLLMLVLIIIPVAIMFINSYFSSQQLLERKYTELLSDLASQLNLRTEEFLEETKKISLVTSYGINSYVSAVGQDKSPVQNFLHEDSKQNENQADQLLVNYIRLKDDIFSIYVYNFNGGKDLLSSTNRNINYEYNPRTEPWFQQFLASDDITRNISTILDQQIKEENSWSILHLRKIFDMSNGNLIGVMVISIDIDFIRRLNHSLENGNSSTYTIVDEQYNIVYSNQDDWIKSPIQSVFQLDEAFLSGSEKSKLIDIDGQQHIIVNTPFNEQKWSSFLHMSTDEFNVERKLLVRNFIVIGSGLLLFALISSQYLTALITRPIKSLMSNMILVEQGKFDNLTKVKSNDEIGLLAHRFEQMSGELKHLVERIYQEESEKKIAEIRALQAQINPHFLYNTLNSVKWIASIQRSDKIVEMTESLIGLLRYTSQNSSQLVQLADELKSIEYYISIQKARYFNKFEVVYQIDPSLLDVSIPKLVLQPMVENAIFHGLADHEDEGEIIIEIKPDEKGDTEITVQDNGRGMDDTTANKMKEQLLTYQVTDESIGVKNVHYRIQHYFGPRYGLKFQSELGKGSRFTIKIPTNR